MEDTEGGWDERLAKWVIQVPQQYPKVVRGVQVIVTVLVVACVVLLMIGDSFLTKFCFYHRSDGLERTVSLDSWELTIAQTTVVLRWVWLGASVIAMVVGWSLWSHRDKVATWKPDLANTAHVVAKIGGGSRVLDGVKG